MENALALSTEAAPAWLVREFRGGVGLIRGEYLQRDLGAYVTEPDVQEATVRYLVDIAGKAAPAPVWYRTSDLDPEEASVLRGVDEAFLEPVPHLGTRGIRRSLRFPRSFQAELNAVRTAQEQCPNLRVLFPFVSAVHEAEAAAKHARDAGLVGELGLMAETPSAVLMLPEMLEVGYGHVLIGCNDLWALTMAEVRRPGNFPTATPALCRLVELARQHTSSRGATLFMAGYHDPTLVGLARRVGVDAIVYHYSQLPKLLGDAYADLPDLDKMADIKRRSRAAIAEYKASLAAR